MKKFSNKNIQKGSFAGIKKNLDSSKSYIIFENDLNKEKDSIFSNDIMAYTYLQKEKYSWQKIMDPDLAREYLVIQINPENEDKVLGKLMGYGFPRDIVYYLYKAKEN